jgi:transcriptional regulator with XRE-family HTH domain
MNTKKWHGIGDLEKSHGNLTLGRLLKAYRDADSLSQTSFAKRLGLSSANLCDIERGRKFPTAMRAAKIAKKLGVSEALLIKLALQDSLRANNLRYSVELKVA